MASSEENRPQRRPYVGFLILVALFLGMLAALRWTPLGDLADRETLIQILEGLRQNRWAPLVFLALYLVLAPLGMPTTPLMAAGAIVFGVFWGSVYNYVGHVLGAVVSYYLARGLGREFILQLVGNRLDRLEKMLDRHGFWAMFRIRFFPIPFPVMNYGPALLGVKPAPYHLGTILGLLVPVPAWTYFWGALLGAASGESSNAGRNLILALGLFLVLSFAPRLWMGMRRRKRLQQLRRQRENRRLS